MDTEECWVCVALPAVEREGGGEYASPGPAPTVALRKNASQDWNEMNIIDNAVWKAMFQMPKWDVYI